MNKKICSICFHNNINTIILPCRHFAICYDCSKELRKMTNKCPICRKDMKKLVFVFNENK